MLFAAIKYVVYAMSEWCLLPSWQTGGEAECHTGGGRNAIG